LPTCSRTPEAATRDPPFSDLNLRASASESVRAFLVSRSTVRCVCNGTLGGANSAVEWPVKNNHGLVVGISESTILDPNGEKFSCDPDFIATHGHTGINDFGQIAGTSFDANFNSRVFLWQEGVMYDLNTLLQPNSPLYLLASGDISNRGEITGLACVVASGTCSSVLHTFVAIVAPATSAGAASASPGADLNAMRPAVDD
jgi:probable HAF family extracellular repeat protein